MTAERSEPVYNRPSDDRARKRGVVAVVLRDDMLLVIRRSRHVVAPRHFCFPGGGVEPGESEPEALVREMREELGCGVHPLQRLWQSVTPWHVALSWWHAEIEGELHPDPAEVESIHWFTPSEILQQTPLLASNRDFLAAWQAGAFELKPLQLPEEGDQSP